LHPQLILNFINMRAGQIALHSARAMLPAYPLLT